MGSDCGTAPGQQESSGTLAVAFAWFGAFILLGPVAGLISGVTGIKAATFHSKTGHEPSHAAWSGPAKRPCSCCLLLAGFASEPRSFAGSSACVARLLHVPRLLLNLVTEPLGLQSREGACCRSYFGDLVLTFRLDSIAEHSYRRGRTLCHHWVDPGLVKTHEWWMY